MRSDHTHFRSLNAAILKMQSEDYQTLERGAQMYNAGLEGSKQDSNEKASKKIYGKDGKVVYASLANLRRSLNKKNKKVAESAEFSEYTELLESVLLTLCEELALDPNELLEDFQTPERAATTRRAVQQAKAMDWYERTSPHTYGKGGRIVKKAKLTKDGKTVKKTTTKKKTPRPIIQGPNGERTGKPDENGRDGRGGWVGGYDGGRGG